MIIVQTRADLDKLPRCNEGDVATVKDTQEVYFYKDGWQLISVQGVGDGISVSLYDLNKTVIPQFPPLSEEDINKIFKLFNTFHQEQKNDFYMLYGKEISYFTVFSCMAGLDTTEDFATVVLDCLRSVGSMRLADWTEDKTAIEIWVVDENNVATCLYLFPYDLGVVPFVK